jgi:hypothetical protein
MFHNLTATGVPDKETIAKFKQPRCGVSKFLSILSEINLNLSYFKAPDLRTSFYNEGEKSKFIINKNEPDSFLTKQIFFR